MANNYTQSTFGPEQMPEEMFTAEDYAFFDDQGLSFEFVGEEDRFRYFYCDDGAGDSEAIHERFQEILRRPGCPLEYITEEAAMTCSKMRSGEFGGYAVYITRDSIEYMSTNQWLSECISGSHKL